ncbi:MAG: hypothetical protein LUI13_12890 [Lachnospiraceae bacterium]|nr:hypothetical protein [Lachnospiraceae bacterium]
MRKAITAVMLTTAMMIGTALTANAAASISTFIPENPVVSEDSEATLAEGATLIVQNADTSAYENETVAQVVEQFNDDSTVTTVKEVLDTLSVDTSGNTKTSSGKTVNATLYEAITPIFDLAIEESDGTVHYMSISRSN